ncbi:MAG TPA: translation initiation factor IF-2 [Symbiobacteriaceae bacterium]|nr:translation initiation factor IF-2 [Symbiobacteriaceae bacterium]
MDAKIRIFELAKELNVNTKRVVELAQSLNVDVKNHMSTIDEKQANQVREGLQAEGAPAEGTKAEATTAEPKAQKPVAPKRDAAPPKASLLDDFFGAGTKPRQKADELKRDLRGGSPLPPPGRATKKAEAEFHAETEVKAAESPVVEQSVQEAAPAPAVVAAPVAEVAAPVEQAPVAQAAVEAPQVEAPAVEAPAAEGDSQETALDSARPLPSGPRAAAPAAPRPVSSGIGLPGRPTPQPAPSAADRALLEGGPRKPAPQAPAAPGAIASGLGMPMKRPPGAPAGPSGPSGLGMPGAPRPGGSGLGMPGRPGERPAGGPRPGGFGGPRPGGFGGAGGRGRPGQGGGLAIPKVDPKVAEAAKPADGKRPIGQGGDRKKGDAFTKRETSASRPSEEQLFGRGRRRPMAKSAGPRTIKPITIVGPMTVKDLASEMSVTSAEVIKVLFSGFGIMATINQELDIDTCALVAGELGAEVTVQEAENILETYDIIEDADEDPELKESRHPVVTIMGHVDHGKTSLLDALRSARVAQGEAGGITQHIGAYEVELNGRKITFLDTPGHEAFTAMRARGANVTDIAILVVAADDSVMPQTIESINHAKAANVPVLVAINKIDKDGADPSRVKQDLTAHGLVAEEWGGETIMVPVSAKQKLNLDLLLENVLILADMLELKSNPDKEARGTIIEAQLDKTRGPVATVLIQGGTLNTGDVFVAGTSWGRVRAMNDYRGKKQKSAGPSTPVQILGFQTVPSAGDVFRVAPDEKTARDIAERRQAKAQSERTAQKAMSLEDFMSSVAQGELKDLNVIVKGDVQGSVEALRGQLEKLRNEEVQVKIVHAAAGAISESDVMLATTSKAVVIGFNVRPDERANRAAQDQGVDVRLYTVIYDIVDDLKAAMTGMLAPKIEEVALGKAEIREIFKVPKAGLAAGCMIIEGKVTRNAKFRLVRDGIVVWNGEINALRRFKDEVKEVATGYECGITLANYQDFKPGDILEAYELKEVKPQA